MLRTLMTRGVVTRSVGIQGCYSVVYLSLVLFLLASFRPAFGQTESVFYSFAGNGAANPEYDLAIDGQSNLYGTTFDNYGGIVYKLTPSGGFTALHAFPSGTYDGFLLTAGVILDSQGNLYGTTAEGGTEAGGTIFKISPNGTETFCTTSHVRTMVAFRTPEW